MGRIKPLLNHEFENLEWSGVFKDFDLIRIRTDLDGSCFFHALAKAYFKPYIIGKINDEPFNRKEFIKNLRKDLSKTLALKIDPEDPNSKTYYSTLSNGELENISEQIPNYSLKNMQKELYSSTTSVSNIYNEFISDQLDLDIYILNSKTKDVYMTGSDNSLLYKNRRSVVILYMPGHYELVGLMHQNKNIDTIFSPNSKFIEKIRSRMDCLSKN